MSINNNKNRPKKYSTNSRLYFCWANMKARCQNPKSPFFKNYGAKGITVCNDWKDYDCFMKWSIENGYKENLTIDRIDNAKGYCPENCRWETRLTQGRNRRNVRYFTFKGKTETLTGFSKILGLNRSTLSQRFYSMGWSINKTLSTPLLKIR